MITTPHAMPIPTPMLLELSSAGLDMTKLISYNLFNEISDPLKSEIMPSDYVGTTTEALWTSGRYGFALEFDGVDDRVTLGTASYQISATGNISIWAWIKPTNLGVGNFVFNYGSFGGEGYQLTITSNKNFTVTVTDALANSATTTDDSDSAADEDEWQMVAVTIDMNSATGLKIYKNGVLVRNEGDTTGVGEQTPIGGFTISNSLAAIEGLVDKFGVTTELLNGSDVLNLYNKGL